MGYLNKVMIIGNLGADPDVRYLPSGAAVVNLSLATTEKWTDKETGERKEKTEWHRASCFGRRAEVLAEYCKKGDSLYIEGSLQTRKWQDKDGNDRWTTEIKIRDFQFLGSRGGSGPRQEPEDEDQDAPSQQPSQTDIDDDIPF